MNFTKEYDEDTGEQRVYSNSELFACVGNSAMSEEQKNELAEVVRLALEAHYKNVKPDSKPVRYLAPIDTFGWGIS